MSNERNGVRRRFTGQQKVAILREHLIDKTPVSEVCDRHGLNPTGFYRWQKSAGGGFENGATAFEARRAGTKHGQAGGVPGINTLNFLVRPRLLLLRPSRDGFYFCRPTVTSSSGYSTGFPVLLSTGICPPDLRRKSDRILTSSFNFFGSFWDRLAFSPISLLRL